MNLFYLDEDFEKCAEAHVDKHIVKMPLEIAQLMCTAIWIDEHLGFVPRALTKPESDKLNALKKPIKNLPPCGTATNTLSTDDVQPPLHNMGKVIARQFRMDTLLW